MTIHLLRSHRRALLWQLGPRELADAARRLDARGLYPSPIRVHAEAARLRRVRGWWLAGVLVGVALVSL